jgi:predicted DNA-binding protein (MmcQ/YjbR family)
MTLDELTAYCAKKKGVTCDTPFGPNVMVFRVGPPSRKASGEQSKMFALAPIDVFETVNLKCDPERAIELRERYDAITPGYHMNKQHWNTIDVHGGLTEKLLRELIDHSYELVRDSLPRKVREELQ